MSVPDLNWDAIVKITKIKLELIPDLDMHIFFEKDAKSRIFYISNRYSKPSNKYLNLVIQNKNQIIIYTKIQIIYMVMQFFELLSTRVVKWIDVKEFDLSKYPSNNSKRCVLEFDFEYSKELQKLHNHYL